MQLKILYKVNFNFYYISEPRVSRVTLKEETFADDVF